MFNNIVRNFIKTWVVLRFNRIIELISGTSPTISNACSSVTLSGVR